MLTFAVPDYYRFVCKVWPEVFISHAGQDVDHPLLNEIITVLQKHQVHLIIDTDDEANRPMSESPLKAWMAVQTTSCN